MVFNCMANNGMAWQEYSSAAKEAESITISSQREGWKEEEGVREVRRYGRRKREGKAVTEPVPAVLPTNLSAERGARE